MIEIERKFLVHKDLWEKAAKGRGNYYRQGYISTDPEKTIRVRLTEEKAFLTIKGKSSGIERLEYEYPIPKEDAKALLDKFTPVSIEKIRYEIIYEGKVWEVDEFKGENEGLIIAEIELQTAEENFSIPQWIDKEVSHDKRYFNSNLSLHPFKSWK